MASAVRFRIRPQASRELERTPEMALFLKKLLPPIIERVKEIAPKGNSPAGKHYVDMIKGEVGFVDGKLIGRINAMKYTSNWIEFGTSKTPAFAPLRRAMESFVGFHRGISKGGKIL